MSRPATTRQAPANRREQILDQALVRMGDGGYRGLSFNDLAERCGLTKQGVLHYFPTKERLLFALLEERDALTASDLVGLLSAGGFESARDPDERREIFRRSLIEIVEHMLATPDLIRLHAVLRAEAIASTHPAKAFFLARDKATLAWLAERMATFDAGPMPTARQILAMLLGLQQLWLQEQHGFDLLAEWRHGLVMLLPSRA